MARSTVASPRPARRAPRPTSAPGIDVRRGPGVKLILVGVVALSLLLFVAFALGRELGAVPDVARQSAARPVIATPRPALTAAEEAYAQALWSIHNDVKASALKVSVASIQYRTNGIEAPALFQQLDASLVVYRRAEADIQALRPPASFQAHHDDYLRAVRLYQQAAAEALKLRDGSREDHLAAAFPIGQEGGKILRRVGAALWPNEYVPS